MKTLCIGSYAPYLGGNATWAAFLTAAGNAAEIQLLDPLVVLGRENPQTALAQMIAEQMRGADAVIAHGFSCADALRAAVANPLPQRRIILVNPVFASGERSNRIAGIARLLFRSAAGKAVLRRIALKKIARLKRDAASVKKELCRLLASEPGAALVQQAVERVAECDAAALAASTVALVNADFSVGVVPPDRIDVVCGTAGFANKVMRPRLQRLLPHAHFHDLPGCGEAVMYEQPSLLRDIAFSRSAGVPVT